MSDLDQLSSMTDEQAGAAIDHPRPAGPWIDAPHRVASFGDFVLESGEVVHDFRLSYVTHGRLAPDRRNAVLVCAAVGANHHRLDFLLGADGALSPERWFVVAVDPIGNGLTTSPSNSTRQPRMRFPRFAIRDMVASQARLLQQLGIERLAAVVGASMGGMQALQWAVSFPQAMDAVVAMTPMARTHPWAVAVNEATRRCLMADPAWNGTELDGDPVRGWQAWVAVLQGLANRTPQALASLTPGEVVAALDARIAQRQALGFDAHDWLYQSWAYDAHDVGTTPGFGGDTMKALRAVRARTLVLAPPLDLYNPVDSAREVVAGVPGARGVEIPSVQGHQAASALEVGDAAFLNAETARFLEAGAP